MRLLQEVKNIKERHVLVRVDFNVPLGEDKTVGEDENWRILKSLETINYLKGEGAKVILISHIGRDKKETLKPVAEYLQQFVPVKFIPTLDPDDVTGIVANMEIGEVVLLENLRQNSGEEKNDQKFCEFLVSLADMYVNEAFPVSHRAHASIVGIPLYLPSYAGLWFQKEVENLSKFLQKPESPFLFILGGSKFDTKIKLIKKFETIADHIFIGGALANNFFKKIGFEVGKSLVDKEAEVGEFFNREDISIPFDVTVKPGVTKDFAELKKSDMIVDIGPNTLEELKNKIQGAKTVLWNGPLGLYEEGYDHSSREILQTISTGKAFSVVGGGDTVKLVEELKLQDKISFVSTGGGAMLQFLADGTLPGIEALSN